MSYLWRDKRERERVAESASELSALEQVQGRVADSSSESSALEQVQEGVADSSRESSALKQIQNREREQLTHK